MSADRKQDAEAGIEKLRSQVREIPGFPVPGILFRDVTPLLGQPGGLAEVTRLLADPFRQAGIGLVAGIEARGFLFGAPLALELGAGFVPVRKPGKLPAETVTRSYDLEYGSAALEIHRDAVEPGARILVVDDLLATGGTALAAAELVESLGGEVVATAFVIELTGLAGRAALAPRDVFSLLRYA